MDSNSSGFNGTNEKIIKKEQLKYYIVDEMSTEKIFHNILDDFSKEIQLFNKCDEVKELKILFKEEQNLEGKITLDKFKGYINEIPFPRNLSIVNVTNDKLIVFIEAESIDNIKSERKKLFVFDYSEGEKNRLLAYKKITQNLKLHFSKIERVAQIPDLLNGESIEDISNILIERILIKCLKTENFTESIKILLSYSELEYMVFEEYVEEINKKFLVMRMK